MRKPSEIVSNSLASLPLRLVASAVSGFLLFASFPSLGWNWLVWVAILPLFLAVTKESRGWRGFLWGYLAGAIFLAGSCYWFVYVMRRYGGLSSILSAGVLLLFLIVFSGFFGAFGWVETWMARRSMGLALCMSPFLWVSLELARTYLITGFPWNLLGYAVESSGLGQIASVTAVYGLSFLPVASAAVLVWFLYGTDHRVRWAMLGGWLIVLVGANWALMPPAGVSGSGVAYLVQPNAPLDEAALRRWQPWSNPVELGSLVTLTEASRALEPSSPGPPPLIIWPESPAPFYFDRDPVFRGAMQTMARETGAYVITGTTLFGSSGDDGPRNSAAVLDPEGRLVLEYDKMHLVPFGEYVPWWAFPSKIGKITFEVGTFVAGKDYKIAETPEGGVAVFICYEAIFPQLVRRLVSQGAGLLVNISDDGWFGHSSAAAQHLAMARLRAIENRRYLLRATNNGITAEIDPYGRVLGELPPHRRMVLPARFAWVGPESFYTRYGDIFAWMCVIFTAACLAFGALHPGVERRSNRD